MVKCLLDGELVVLGGPNLLEAGYYSLPPRPPREDVIRQQEIVELMENCKVVDELVDKYGIVGLMILYIPCLDWSNRTERLIELVIKQFLEFERIRHRSIKLAIRPPKVITVVQDKDYWPGSELEDPLVLERRAAKEKEYMDNPQDRIKPDHKKVKLHLVNSSSLYHAKFLVRGVPRRNLVKHKKTLAGDEKQMQLLAAARRPGSVVLKECIAQETRNHSPFLKMCIPDIVEDDVFDELFPRKCSTNYSNTEKLINEKSTPSTLVEQKKQLPVAEPSLLKRFGLDSDGDSLFYAPIPRKRRCFKTGSAHVEEKEKKQLPSAQLRGGDREESISMCTTFTPQDI